MDSRLDRPDRDPFEGEIVECSRRDAFAMSHRLDEASHMGVSHLSPVQRGLIVGDVEAAGTPIILVHGVIDNRSIFTLLRRALRGRGFRRTYALNYSQFTDAISAVACPFGIPDDSDSPLGKNPDVPVPAFRERKWGQFS